MNDTIEHDEILVGRRMIHVPTHGQVILFDQFTLFRRSWKWVLLFSVLATIAAGIYAFTVIPVEYKATAVALPPNKSGTPLDNIAGGVASTLKDFGFSKLVGKGGAEAGYSKTILLTSRPIMDSMIARYDLYRRYNIPRNRFDLMYATVGENISVEISEEGPISVSVYDTNARTAAAMANDVIRFTNQLAMDLNRLETEPITRIVEGRLVAERARQEQLSAQLRDFMRKNRIYDPENQATVTGSALVQAETNVASQRALVEIYAKALGDDDPRTRQAREVLAQYEEQSRKMAAGQSGALPGMSLQKAPAAMTEYLHIRQDYEVNAKVLAFLEPLYEQTKYDEIRDIPVLNILEPALPPVLKARPRRSLILASVFVGTFIVAYLCIAVSAYGSSFIRRYRSYSRNGALALHDKSVVSEEPYDELRR
jgi:uncharacterized protein involved in exopolysaccharide biosynthesis